MNATRENTNLKNGFFKVVELNVDANSKTDFFIQFSIKLAELPAGLYMLYGSWIANNFYQCECYVITSSYTTVIAKINFGSEFFTLVYIPAQKRTVIKYSGETLL